MDRNVLSNLTPSLTILRDQCMSTINLITSTRTTEDMWNHVIANNLMESMFPLRSSPTATQLSQLVTSGNTKERTLKVKFWKIPTQPSHVDSSPSLFSMTHSNWRRREVARSLLMRPISHGLLICSINSQTLKKDSQVARPMRISSGTICKMSISLSGWEPPVSQISESFGEEYQVDLMLEIMRYTFPTSLKYPHSKERNISCYQQQTPLEVRITS